MAKEHGILPQQAVIFWRQKLSWIIIHKEIYLSVFNSESKQSIIKYNNFCALNLIISYTAKMPFGINIIFKSVLKATLAIHKLKVNAASSFIVNTY